MMGRTITCLYCYLLKLYPGRFRGEFDREMGLVFYQALSGLGDPDIPAARRRVMMTRLFLREIWYFPVSYLDARRYQRFLNASDVSTGFSSYVQDETSEAWVGRSASWGAALLGALPFLLFGLAYYLKGFAELNGYYPLVFYPLVKSIDPYIVYTTISNTVRYAPMVVYLIVALGTLFGLLRSFPRWSYAYLGMAFYFSWYYFNGSYHGVVYGWRARVPLIAAIVLGTLLARSLRPLARLFQGVWNDWTRLSFALYAFAVPMFTVIFFDDDWGTSQLYGLLLDTLLLAAGAVAFLRSRTTWGRVLSLQAIVLILVVKGMLIGGWLPFFDQPLPTLIRSAFLFIIIYFGFLLLPGVIGLLRRGLGLFSVR